VGLLEPEQHVIVLQLKGVSGVTEKPISAPITTRQKIVCPACGTKNKSSFKFCTECGSSLR